MAASLGYGPARRFPALLAAVLLLGIADSITGPYLVLFAAEQAGLSPLRIGGSAQLVGYRSALLVFGLLALMALTLLITARSRPVDHGLASPG